MYVGFFFHHLTPLEVAEDGDDDIQAIETRLEGDVLVKVQPTGDHIHHNPYEPLLQVFPGQGPDAHDAQGGGEGVEDGDGAVGKTRQQEVNGGPDQGSEAEPDEGHLPWHVAYGQLGGFLLVTHPGDEAVDRHGEVVELHAAVGVKAFLVVKHDAEALHHEAHDPHPDAGLVLQEDVSQAEGGGQYVEPMV